MAEKSSPGERNSVQSWAEGSVWSMVCAMELGLISEPCLTSVSFATLRSDEPLTMQTNIAIPKEFPPITSSHEVAKRSTRKPSLRLRICSQPLKKPTGKLASVGRRGATVKSTTEKRNVYGDWRVRELDRARNSTVEDFWKSCKRKPGRPRKQTDRDSQDHFDKDLFGDKPPSVDLASGICTQDFPSPKQTDEKITSNVLQTTNTQGNTHLDHQLRRKNAGKLITRGRRRRRTKRKAPRKIIDNVLSKEVLPKRHDSFDSSQRKEETTYGDATVDYQWDDDNFYQSPPPNYLQEDTSSIDVLDDPQDSTIQENNEQLLSTSIEELPNDILLFEEPTMEPMDVSPSSPPSPQGSFFGFDERTWLDDIDTQPLAERIPNRSKCSTEDDENYSTVDTRCRRKYPGRSSSDSCTISTDARGTTDVDSAEDLKRSSVDKPRRRGRSSRNSGGSGRNERSVVVDNDNDSRSRSAAGGIGRMEKKRALGMKRSKITPNGNGIGGSLKDTVKTAVMLRARMFRNEDEYHDIRRVTRGSTKITKENFVGKLVWGCCSGWWPALIIDADHVGMLSEAGKLWVYWIGEARISLLNEKTQIESFRSNLTPRLDQTSNVALSRAIDATMQMLHRQLGCALTKPYSRWIENNFSEMIDELKFYPYPAKVQQRLASLKERNARVTEKYLLDQKRESQPKKLPEKPKESPQQSNNVDLTRLPLGEQNPGVITWAKIAGHNWWPAMIIDYRDCCMREPSFGCQWIMWYGDYKLSEIHHQSFLRFDKGVEKMRDYINNTKKHTFLVGVLQASKDYCFRMGCETDNWTLANVFKYFSKMSQPQTRQNSLKKGGESVKIYDKYSTHIVEKLNELKNNSNVDNKRADDIRNSDDLRSVTTGKTSLESLCLKCLKNSDGPMEAHPFFEGSLCVECSEEYKPCMFVFGNDAKCFYCTICAATGTMIICDNEDCPRVYCTACMKHLLCTTTYEQVLQEDPWSCFLCKTRSGTVSDTIMRPRSNWKDKIIDMFRTNSNPSVHVAQHTDKRRRIRVLSLFDGLSTGLLVLLKLGLAVDVYYASEIDPDALMVSVSHFGDRVVHLGDVRDITKEKIKEIAPIDLLIGGSPCNDLSLANPARLGLYDPKGTGVLFFEYCRIMKLVKKLNNRRHMFWMYENVASMPTEYRLEINKHLGQEPDVIDSADFSPQHRLRLYWHNLPIEPHSLPFQGEQDVQDILTPHCHRYALVKKIRTVTTKVNSLKQGKLALKPILMKDESDSLWITELEEIFGFPRHYTDVKNLSATKRQRLIGKSWSVQTLIAILRSLCPYFECNITVGTQFTASSNIHG